MDSKPFSAPAPSTDSKPETSGVTEIKPPATVTLNSTPYNEYQTLTEFYVKFYKSSSSND